LASKSGLFYYQCFLATCSLFVALDCIVQSRLCCFCLCEEEGGGRGGGWYEGEFAFSHLDDCNIPQLFVVNGVLLDLYDRRVSIDEEGI